MADYPIKKRAVMTRVFERGPRAIRDSFPAAKLLFERSARRS
jgi:hypothetical protein